jgi:microcystin-dependent protein
MEVYLGFIAAFGFNYAPLYWMTCQGQTLAISSNSALFALLGNMYGGDGVTTFKLPDLQGRTLVGIGNGAGLTPIQQGEIGGSESVTLTANNLPLHNHTLGKNATIAVNTVPGDESSPANNFLTANNNGFSGNFAQGQLLGPSIGGTTDPTGSSQPIGTRNPFLGINYCIAVQGIFPPRN